MQAIARTVVDWHGLRPTTATRSRGFLSGSPSRSLWLIGMVCDQRRLLVAAVSFQVRQPPLQAFWPPTLSRGLTHLADGFLLVMYFGGLDRRSGSRSP